MSPAIRAARRAGIPDPEVDVKTLTARMQRKVGAAPGTMVYVGRREAAPLRLAAITYDADRLEEHGELGLEDCLALRGGPGVTWIDATGLGDTDGLHRLCEHFGVHPLVQEDLVNTTQRPKSEAYGDHLLLIGRMLRHDAAGVLVPEQISLVLGDGWLLSFQERPGDVFDPVRQRLRQNRPRLRGGGSDYLAYALLDAVVDGYFVVVETLAERVEDLEDDLIERPTSVDLATLHRLKRQLIAVRRAAWPLREVMADLVREETPLLQADMPLFLRDVADHAVQVSEAVDSLRDVLGGLQDLHLATVSNRMNEVMKVLTIMGSLFIPLTFLAGIYGMNFEHMPELGWRWSYLVFWLAMLGLAGGLIGWFRRRRWL